MIIEWLTVGIGGYAYVSMSVCDCVIMCRGPMPMLWWGDSGLGRVARGVRVYIEPGRGRSGPPVSTDSMGEAGGGSAWREGLASLAGKPPGEAPIYSISVGP